MSAPHNELQEHTGLLQGEGLQVSCSSATRAFYSCSSTSKPSTFAARLAVQALNHEFHQQALNRGLNQQEDYTHQAPLDIQHLRHLLCRGTIRNCSEGMQANMLKTWQVPPDKRCYTAETVTIACCCCAVAITVPTYPSSAPAAQKRRCATAEHTGVVPCWRNRPPLNYSTGKHTLPPTHSRRHACECAASTCLCTLS
jgi:hypothetical protein